MTDKARVIHEGASTDRAEALQSLELEGVLQTTNELSLFPRAFSRLMLAPQAWPSVWPCPSLVVVTWVEQVHTTGAGRFFFCRPPWSLLCPVCCEGWRCLWGEGGNGGKRDPGATPPAQSRPSPPPPPVTIYLCHGGVCKSCIRCSWPPRLPHCRAVQFAAKVAAIHFDNTVYLLAGSKNTCLVWPADAPAPAERPEAVLPCRIAAVVSQWLLGLAPDRRRSFLDDCLAHGTLMGEFNAPDSEHMVPIREQRLDMFALLDVDGVPLHPKVCWRP